LLKINKQEKLKKQNDITTKHYGLLIEAKKKYEEYMKDTSASLFERRQRILTLCDAVISQNIEFSLVTNPKIKMLQKK